LCIFANQTHALKFETRSSGTIEIAMRRDHSSSKIQFVDSALGISADVIVGNGNGDVVTSIKVMLPSTLPLIGLAGARNNFLIQLNPPNSTLSHISGSELDDHFWIFSAGRILEVNGGNGTGNGLHIMESFQRNVPLVVDLRVNGSVTFPGDDEDSVLVDSLKNIQTFHGRTFTFEKVYVGCDTHLVSEADEVWITDTDCGKQSLTVIVGPQTEVYFQVPEGDAQYAGATLSSAIINYRFKSLRSFDYNFEHWFQIRDVKQNFYLNFNLRDLDKLLFLEEESKKLLYVISNQTFTHSVDPYLDPTQEFFQNPKFILQDGSGIKLFRNGGMLVTLGNPGEMDTVESLSSIADRLSVTIIAQTHQEGFLYLGHSGASVESPNILTNSMTRPSHLYGGGSNHTWYVILSLEKDVHIYPGLPIQSTNEERTLQVIDLSEIIWLIRQKTQTKYVPRLEEYLKEDYLAISMGGLEAEYSGKIKIRNWAVSQGHIEVLLNSVFMEIHPKNSTHARLRRETGMGEEETVEWGLVPKPLILQGGVVSVAAEDLEDGMKITSYTDDFRPLQDTLSFDLVSNGSDLLITNMLGNSTDGGKTITTLVLLDHLGDLERKGEFLNRTSLHEFDISISLGNVELELTKEGRAELQESIRQDWEDILEESEKSILQGLDAIERQFIVPIYRKVWKRHFYVMVGVGLAFEAVCIITILLITRALLKWRHVLDLSKKEATQFEPIQLKEIVQLDNDKE